MGAAIVGGVVVAGVVVVAISAAVIFLCAGNKDEVVRPTHYGKVHVGHDPLLQPNWQAQHAAMEAAQAKEMVVAIAGGANPRSSGIGSAADAKQPLTLTRLRRPSVLVDRYALPAHLTKALGQAPRRGPGGAPSPMVPSLRDSQTSQADGIAMARARASSVDGDYYQNSRGVSRAASHAPSQVASPLQAPERAFAADMQQSSKSAVRTSSIHLAAPGYGGAAAADGPDRTYARPSSGAQVAPSPLVADRHSRLSQPSYAAGSARGAADTSAEVEMQQVEALESDEAEESFSGVFKPTGDVELVYDDGVLVPARVASRAVSKAPGGGGVSIEDGVLMSSRAVSRHFSMARPSDQNMLPEDPDTEEQPEEAGGAAAAGAAADGSVDDGRGGGGGDARSRAGSNGDTWFEQPSLRSARSQRPSGSGVAWPSLMGPPTDSGGAPPTYGSPLPQYAQQQARAQVPSHPRVVALSPRPSTSNSHAAILAEQLQLQQQQQLSQHLNPSGSRPQSPHSSRNQERPYQPHQQLLQHRPRASSEAVGRAYGPGDWVAAGTAPGKATNSIALADPAARRVSRAVSSLERSSTAAGAEPPGSPYTRSHPRTIAGARADGPGPYGVYDNSAEPDDDHGSQGSGVASLPGAMEDLPEPPTRYSSRDGYSRGVSSSLHAGAQPASGSSHRASGGGYGRSSDERIAHAPPPSQMRSPLHPPPRSGARRTSAQRLRNVSYGEPGGGEYDSAAPAGLTYSGGIDLGAARGSGGGDGLWSNYYNGRGTSAADVPRHEVGYSDSHVARAAAALHGY